VAVKKIAHDEGTVQAVELEDGSLIRCGSAIVTAGSWSALIAGLPEPTRLVKPARGQLVLLRTDRQPLRGVVFGPGCYLVPRDDGRVLVGSTIEFVGHLREVTAGAVRDLLAAATALVPELASACFERAWSNFRPYAEGGLPLIGSTDIRGLLLATGHHRNGILLAPITAEIVKALVTGREPPTPLAPYSPLPSPTSA
jgi:glycine oxidase